MKRLTSFGHLSETLSPIKTQRPAGKTKKQSNVENMEKGRGEAD